MWCETIGGTMTGAGGRKGSSGSGGSSAPEALDEPPAGKSLCVELEADKLPLV